MNIKCIIVDDEPLARSVIKKFLLKIPSLRLIKECANAIEAASVLHENKIDLMFLDIKMPELSGLDFLKTLQNPPRVILTTAFPEYALEGYEYSVVDYLLKPIAFGRFLKAVNKAIEQIGEKKDNQTDGDNLDNKKCIFLHADKAEHKINLADILYIEGYGNFVKIYSIGKMLLVPGTMTAIQDMLPSNKFIRVHKSFIVPFEKIDKLEGNTLKIKDKRIPVGKYYKKEFEEGLKKFTS
jgi:two-component system, LytTR family, response regulator